MLELEQARKLIFDSLVPLPPERALVSDAAGRFLAQPVVAPINLPIFDNSAMDGFAVHAEDLTRASRASPVVLRVIGEIPAGNSSRLKIDRGTCVQLFTGSPL